MTKALVLAEDGHEILRRRVRQQKAPFRLGNAEMERVSINYLVPTARVAALGGAQC